MEELNNNCPTIKNNNAQELSVPKLAIAIFDNVQNSRVFDIYHKGRRLHIIKNNCQQNVYYSVIRLKYFINWGKSWR
jgi:hypothetical protein